MDPNNNLKLVFSTVAFVLFWFGFGYVVCTIAHQVFVAALRASTHCYALILVGIQFEEVTAAFASDVSKVVDRIFVRCAVPSQLLTKISVTISVPIVAAFRKSHRFSDAERYASPGARGRFSITKPPDSRARVHAIVTRFSDF